MQILEKMKKNILERTNKKKKTIDVLNSFLQKVILIVLQNYEFTKVSFTGFYIGNFVLIQLKKFKYWRVISSRK